MSDELVKRLRRRWDWSNDEETINGMIDERAESADAIAAWNRRADLARHKAAAEAAEDRVKELEGANAALRAANDMLLRAITGDDNG